MTPVLREATEEDLDGIMALETASFPTDAWSPSAMRRDLRSRDTHYLVATPDDDPSTVLAYAGLLAPRGSGEGDVQTIAVAPEVRRAGLGRRLMTELLDEAERRGARRVFLEVRADNPTAQALYDSLGFERVGVRPRYYQPDGVDAIVMRRETEGTP